MQQVSVQAGQRGFTLTELLAVMAILSVLTGILLPVFSAAREKARQVQCLSNQRQLGHAFMMYTQDYDEMLPFFGDRSPGPRVFWNDVLVPYIRSKRTLSCPSWPRGGKYKNRQGQVVTGEFGIGVNYGVVFRYGSVSGIPLGSESLLSIPYPERTMLLTDAQGGRHVYSPAALWPMSVDWDRDGFIDSNPGVLSGEGPYNRGDPFRHNGGAVCTFADGHSRWIDARSWIANRDDMWGASLLRR